MKVTMTKTFLNDLKHIFSPNLYQRFKDWQHSRWNKKQRYKMGYAYFDCYSFHYWFCETIPDMLRILAERKMGAPELPFEEFEHFPLQWVEEQAKILLKQKNKNKWLSKDEKQQLKLWGSDCIYDRWWVVIMRIAWCLEQAHHDNDCIEKNEYEEEYFNSMPPLWDCIEEDSKDGLYNYKSKCNKELQDKYFKREKEIWQFKEDCKNEAFDLMKKYFYTLWD